MYPKNILNRHYIFCYIKTKVYSDLYCTNHILDLLWMKHLGFFRVNIIYTSPLWKCLHIKEFRCNVLLVIIGQKLLWCIIPSKIKSFYISIAHFPITIITTFFDVGIFGPIIFGITISIATFKLRFRAKLVGKGILDVLIPKTACINFMLIPCLALLMNLIVVDSRHIVACHKMMIKTLAIHSYVKV